MNRKLGNLVALGSIFLIPAASWAASTPETTLLSSVIAVSGERLSQSEMQDQVGTLLQNYDKTAPSEGRTERIEQALVSLGIDTPEQAQAFEAQVEASAQELSSANFTSNEEAQKAFETQVIGLVSSSQGAQFSGCTRLYTLGVISGAALAFGLAGTGSTTAWVQNLGAGLAVTGAIGLALDIAIFSDDC